MPKMRAAALVVGLTSAVLLAPSSALAGWPAASLPAVRFCLSQYDVVRSRRAEPIRDDSGRIRWLATSCYPNDFSPEERALVEEQTGLLPPMLAPGAERYVRDVSTWVGEAGLGPNFWAVPAHLTYSFPPSNTTWGGLYDYPSGPNVLPARLLEEFGSVERGREFIRQCFAGYEVCSGITYDEVADDGAAMSNSESRSAFRGDIRVGGIDDACGSCLAWDAFPSGDGIVMEGGGDMCIRTDFYWESDGFYYRDSADNYRYFRNTVSHEHGHGTGAIHVVPCNETKNMEPVISTAYDALEVDDIRGLQRSYGDRYAGNHSFTTPHDYGTLATIFTQQPSIYERWLSVNTSNITNNTDEDWFRFTVGITSDVYINAFPVGGAYTAGQQSSSCSGTTASIDASSAGDLGLYFYNDPPSGYLYASLSGGPGDSESLTLDNLPPGTYLFRVRNMQTPSGQDQYVQLYNLTLRINGQTIAPFAKAGVNKRVNANTQCHLIGDINSAAQEIFTGIAQYDWDVDGDGVYEVVNDPQTSLAYPSNGDFFPRLRVTDTNDVSATDSIRVTVTGAYTQVSSVAPNDGAPGTTVPVTIHGRNFKHVTLAHISISGSGISLVGSPVSNALGTVLTGVSLQISGGAPLGLRNLTISNSDGSATGFSVFSVAPPPCADVTGDGMVTFADITRVLQHFGSFYLPGNGPGDANEDGFVNFADITYVLQHWGESCA
jgi:hypothetical protein